MKLIKIAISAVLAATPFGLAAQDTTSESTLPILAVPSEQSVDYRERTVMLNVHTNTDFAIASDADWLSVRQGDGGNVYVHVEQNTDPESRQGTITFSTTDNSLSRTLVINQTRDESAETLTPVRWITPSSATANQTHATANSGIENTLDGNTSTLYHSPYTGYDVSETNPIILTYYFTNVEQIDFINYIPRVDGNTNGNFGQVAIYVVCDGNDGTNPVIEMDFEESSSARCVEFDEPLVNPTQIKFQVTSGAGNFASCAEMQFGVTLEIPGSNIFKDKLMTELVDGFTEDDLDTLSNAFIRTLATKLLSGEYDTNFRVGEFECLLDPYELSDEWSTPGKYYDQVQGVTGIMLTEGSTAIIVDGIPQDKAVGLRVIAWAPEEIDEYKSAGSTSFTYQSESFALRNGVNVIERTSTWPGLAYITYYSTSPEGADDIQVHFVNTQVNGYLTPHQSNDELQEILDNSCYTTIDLFGDRVHSVWEVSALNQYTSGRYVEMMNILDSLIAWQHYLIGFEKYDRVPTNKTLAYVNYNYYMYQGTFGVSFMYNTQYRVLSPSNMRYYDSDAIWGFSHEWGHQHQMNPYFCWSNLGESSNNMNAVYNMLRMGYVPSSYSNYVSGEDNADRIVNTLNVNLAAFFNNYLLYGDEVTTGGISSGRTTAYENRNSLASSYGWSTDMVAMAEAMEDATVYGHNVWSGLTASSSSMTRNPNAIDEDRSLSMNEVNLNSINTVIPYYMLHNYFAQKGDPEYVLDKYELIRTTDERGQDNPDVSELLPERTRQHDKYALLASVQNQITDVSVFTTKYPNSVWTTKSYINANMNAQSNIVPYILNYIRAASLRSGYNLYPYFKAFGFLRLIACYVGDYTNAYYCLTQDMRDEFEQDMEDLGLQEVSDDMIVEILSTSLQTFSHPDFSNDPTPVTD